MENDLIATTQALRQHLSDAFIRYALNLADETNLDGFVPSPGVQTANIEALARFGGAQIDDSTPLDYMRWLGLTAYVPNTGTSLINTMRMHAGGDVRAALPTGDDVVDALAEVARDVWPIYLIWPKEESGATTFWMGTPVGAFQHPSLARILDAVLSDESFKKLFPYAPVEADPPTDEPFARMRRIVSLLITNLGGGTMQLGMLLPGLVATAAFRCLMSGEPITMSSMVNTLRGVVDDVRRLGEGEAVDVPAIIGYSGAEVPAGSIEMEDLKLRSVTQTDREVFLSGSKNLTAVMECNFPLQVYAVRENNFDTHNPLAGLAKFDPQILESTRLVARKLDVARLGLLLASSNEEPWLLQETARYVSNPLQTGGFSTWDPQASGVLSYTIEAAQFAQVSTWYSRIKENHHSSLDIGVRRLLLAATERTDPIDGFVDAVIVWENMFGAKAETVFRVTASIAKLLESEASERAPLRTELGKIYDRRSKLVHGGSEPSLGEAWKLRDRAVVVATECFRALFSDRPDLLELDSSTRGARLLIE